jgi:hypothetical protein
VSEELQLLPCGAMQYVDCLHPPGTMPVTTPKKPVVVNLTTESREWQVIENVRSKFGTEVKGEDGSPKVNKDGEVQIRRPAARDVLGKIVATLLLDAPPEALEALAAVAKDKATTAGKPPAFKTSEFIRSIVAARGVSVAAPDLATLPTEQLEAELAKRKAAQAPGGKTKGVAAL